METIYSDMVRRNYALLSASTFVADPLLLEPDSDPRRCIALVARGVWSDGPDPIPALDVQGYFVEPKPHHTFLVCRGWGGSISEPDAERILGLASKVVPRYSIHFDRIIPVATGIALCGTPSIDLNKARDTVRSFGLTEREPYHLDIAHTTLWRCVSSPPEKVKDSILSTLAEQGEGKVYRTLQVTHLDLLEASWTLQPNTYRRLGQVTLWPGPTSSD